MHEILARGSYAQVLQLNWWVHLKDYGHPGFGGWIGAWYVDILWRFLLGFVIGRGMLQRQSMMPAGVLRRLLPWTLATGLAGNAVMSARLDYDLWSVENGLLDALLAAVDEVWVLALAVGYVCILALLYQRPGWDRILGMLAPVGRMALTNYVTQSAFLMRADGSRPPTRPLRSAHPPGPWVLKTCVSNHCYRTLGRFVERKRLILDSLGRGKRRTGGTCKGRRTVNQVS